ncbi:MAG: Bug family tripartite tricarboxylate transporter substrate binding protein [Burkholderiales bacterium]
MPVKYLRLLARTTLLLVLCGARCPPHPAETPYPSRPIRLIVAVAPGGGTDIISRLIAARLTESLGQTVIVDNRGGGNFIIGTNLAAKALPDGHTLLTATNASHAINPGLFRDLPYDPLKDFTPVVALAGVPVALVVMPSFPAKSVKEFIAHAKAQDGKLTHGSSGTGGTGHLTAELFKAATGVRAIHVPYKSDGPALVDLLGGQISFMFPNMPAIVPYVKAGRLRALAVSSTRRSAILPDTPTLTELGVNVDINGWYCIMGPAGMPKAVVSRLNTEINRILTLPDVKEQLASLGATIMGGAPEQVTALIKSDMAKYAQAIKASGAKPD